MFLKHTKSGDLVEVIELRAMFDPFVGSIQARSQAGEDTQDVHVYDKTELIFPSGEALPLCWRDSHYREHAA